MNRTLRSFVFPSLAVLALAGCSTSATEAEQTTPDATGVEQADTPSDGDDASAWPDVDDAEEQGFYGPGEYLAMNMTGAGFIMTIPAAGPEDIEAYREATGQEAVGYIQVEIDNTNGYEDASPYSATIVDSEGQELEYRSAFSVIEEWGPTMRDDGPEDVNDGYWYSMPDGTEISEDEYGRLNSQGIDVYNAYLDTSASPTAKKTVWLLGPEVPAEMTYIELSETTDSYQASPLE